MALSLFSETYAQNSNEGLSRSWRLIVTFSIYFILPIYLFVFFNAEDLLGLIYGNDFMGAGTGLILYLGFLTINQTSGANYYGDTLYAINKNQIVLRSTIEASLMNLVLNVVLIPSYGELGAITGTGSSILYMALRRWFVLKEYIQMKLVWLDAARATLFVLLPAMVSKFISVLVNAHVLLNALVYGFLLLVLLVCIRPMTKEEAVMIVKYFPFLGNFIHYITKN